MRHSTQNGREGLRLLPRLLLLGLVAAPLAGCNTDDLLQVEDPEFPTEETVILPVRIAGAIGDFQVAYSGAGDDSWLSVSAVFTDEFYSSGTFTTRTALDQRDLFDVANGNTSDAVFSRLQRARQSLSTTAAIVAAEATGEVASGQLAQLRALEGFTYVALGEGFCSAIPFSEPAEGAGVNPGEPLSTVQVFDTAIVRFNAALAVQAGSNLAAVGKGRALLDNAQYQEAAAAVANVPTEFVYLIEHSANDGRQYNPIFALQDNGRYSVSNDEGGIETPFPLDMVVNGDTIPNFTNIAGEGLPFLGAMDPRVPWAGPFSGFDADIPLYADLRYTSFTSNVALASGVEARLIEAEAALQSGNSGDFLEILNDLREDVGTLVQILAPDAPFPFGQELSPLTDPGTMAGRVDLLFSERAFWMFTTGHRLGDLRRLIRQYGRTPDSVFPTGPYFKGGEYGSDIALPVPFDEENNPLFRRAECSTTEA